MNQFIVTLFVAVVIFSGQVFSERIEVKIKFLNDILRNENVPSAIVVKASCWSKIEMFQFSKSMNFLVAFAYDDVVTNQPLDDYSNKIWFFVDMKCMDSVNYVAKVRN